MVMKKGCGLKKETKRTGRDEEVKMSHGSESPVEMAELWLSLKFNRYRLSFNPWGIHQEDCIGIFGCIILCTKKS